MSLPALPPPERAAYCAEVIACRDRLIDSARQSLPTPLRNSLERFEQIARDAESAASMGVGQRVDARG